MKSSKTFTEDNTSRIATKPTSKPNGVGLPLSITWKLCPIEIPSWSITEVSLPLSRRVSFDLGSSFRALE